MGNQPSTTIGCHDFIRSRKHAKRRISTHEKHAWHDINDLNHSAGEDEATKSDCSASDDGGAVGDPPEFSPEQRQIVVDSWKTVEIHISEVSC